MLRTVHIYFIQFSQLSEVDTLIILTLLREKLRPREVKSAVSHVCLPAFLIFQIRRIMPSDTL